MELPATKQEKIKLTEINQYLTCYLCKGYFIDATTISECLHSFCRSCIIKFLQDNSYCPVCELIINKAKPNLKLDKTLQDIVYKLVPELFLKEMLRRKTFYKDYPQIASRVSPEERGEDTERTIFNPQEMISLSLEYICDDSTPGAIRIPGIATDPETLKNNCSTAEGQDSQMKRYLLCPGMCRVEVLKKFVRNKYNVDTSQFFIDVLYKRVPLPDHYTLIDIAYIYSWQRNELMKFFFRIIDRNKAKRTDSPVNNLPQFIPRHFRRNKSHGERTKRESAADKKSLRKSVGKVGNGASKHPSQHDMKKESKLSDKNSRDKPGVKSEHEIEELSCGSAKSGANERTNSCDGVKWDPVNKNDSINKENVSNEIETKLDKIKVEKCKESSKNDDVTCQNDNGNAEALKIVVSKTDKENEVVNKKVDKEVLKHESNEVPNDQKEDLVKTTNGLCQNDVSNNIITKVEEPDNFSNQKSLTIDPIAPVPVIKKEPISPEAAKADNKLILKVSKEFLDNVNLVAPKPQVFSKPVTKSYTSITLNRSENVEIITKIEPVSNRDGKPIGHHIIKQTIKKGSKVKTNSPKKVSTKAGQVTIPRLVITKKGIKKKTSPKREIKPVSKAAHIVNGTNKTDTNIVQSKTIKVEADMDDEKSKFFKYMNLTPTSNSPFKTEIDETSHVTSPVKKEITEPTQFDPAQAPKKQIIISRPTGGQKRKSSSPVKNEKAKVPKVEAKKAVKIILHEKPSLTKSSPSSLPTGMKNDTGLQSLISNCKIPSSLSITIKESSEKDTLPLVVPPVKNYIEILKLPEESPNFNDKDKPQISDIKPKEPTKFDLSKFCDNDSEQKVDQDLSEIAKSLTEKIPMSTTISHMVGPKQQFQIPIKTNIPSKVQIQPAPVPEINKALNVGVSPKENLVKLTPRSPQTFQKIFEESLKKPPEGPKTSAVELPANDANTPTSNKRNILEIASQLFKKTKLELDKKSDVALPKVAIPRLHNSRAQKVLSSQQPAKLVPKTVASLHSTSLGLNYTVSVGQQSPSKVMKSNGIVSPVKAESVPGVPECKPSVSPLNELKSIKTDFKVPSPSLGSPKLPEVSSALSSSPKPKTPSPKHSPKSSPLVKHMYAPTVPMFNQKIPSPMNRFASLSPKPQSTPKPSSPAPRLCNPTLRPSTTVPTTKASSPTPSSSSQNGTAATLSPNEILEKYNIQNLAQLTASFNLNSSVLASNQLAAFQHAMLLKHFEIQNRQNWLSRNQGPLLQYEKYLQSLNGGINGSHNQT